MIETLTAIRNALRSERGQALGEYALILGLVALAAIVALGLLGAAIGGPFNEFVSLSGFASGS